MFRTVTNVPQRVKNDNDNANEGGAGGAGDAAQEEVRPSTSTSTSNADNYDATKARKSKRKSEGEGWQDKILKCLEPVDVPETPKKDYLDAALEAVSLQMKENLSNNEMLDLIEDIQNMVNRACREKWRRLEMANQVSNNTSNNQMFQGPGPQGPMALQVNYDDQQHQQQQPFYNTF